MLEERIEGLEHLVNVRAFTGIYKGKQLVFAYEFDSKHPFGKLKILMYGNRESKNLDFETVNELSEVISRENGLGEPRYH